MSCDIANFQKIQCNISTIALAQIETPESFLVRITNPNTFKSYWFVTSLDGMSVVVDVSSESFDVGVPYQFSIFSDVDSTQKGAIPFQEIGGNGVNFNYYVGILEFTNTIGGTATDFPTAQLTLKP